MKFGKKWKYAAGALLGLSLLASVSVYTFAPEFMLGTLADWQMKDFKMQPKNILVNGHKVHYVEGGQGKETIVLVHGFRSSKAYWIPYLPEFLSQYHVIALDLPGHGSSDRGGPNQHYDLRSLGNFLDDFIQAMNLKNIRLVGASMGGGVVLSYASSHSDNIKSIALINPLAVQPPRMSEVHQALGRGENLLLPKDMEGFYTMQEVVYGSRLELNPVIEKLILNALVQQRDFYVMAFNEMIEKGGLEDCLDQVKAPILIVQGDKDRVVDPSCVSIVQGYIPHTEVVWIKDGAHTLRGAHRTQGQSSICQFFLKQDSCIPSDLAASE